MRLHIGILDKDLFWRERVEKSVRLKAEEADIQIELNIECFSSVNSFKMQSSEPMDAVFLETDFGEEESGIETAQWIRYQWNDCMIIFLSNDCQYIMESYLISNAFFLLKSYYQKYLPFILKRIRYKTEQDILKLVFKLQGRVQQYEIVYFSEILYLERLGRRTKVVCKDREFFISEKLDEVRKRSGKDVFLRCHNSFLVNTMEVKSFSRYDLTLSSGVQVPVSRSYRNSMIQHFKKYNENLLVQEEEEEEA